MEGTWIGGRGLEDGLSLPVPGGKGPGDGASGFVWVGHSAFRPPRVLCLKLVSKADAKAVLVSRSNHNFLGMQGLGTLAQRRMAQTRHRMTKGVSARKPFGKSW
jgi:hypothetical protein